MCGEGCARVHEHTHEYRTHGKGYDVDAQEVVTHEQRQYDWKQCDERIEHGYAARLVEIVAAEEHEVGGEDDDHDADEHDLSYQRARNLVFGGCTAFHLALKRAEHTVGVVVYNVATVDYLLAAHHHATCWRDAA